jgi:translation elongation factor EF-1beta
MENVTHSWDAATMTDHQDAASGNGNSILTFRAVERIVPGQESCIAYVEGLCLPTNERTQALKDFKFFTCRCPRCQSPDEQGRVEAIVEWDHLAKALSGDEEKESSSDAILPTYKRRCELAEVLYPSFYVSKGLAMEELAHALLDASSSDAINNDTYKQEAVACFEKAKTQYTICRGESSIFVSRVIDSLDTLLLQAKSGSAEEKAKNESQQPNATEDEEDEDADLRFTEGWNQVLLEVKTYESLPDLHLEQMATRIKTEFFDDTVVQWAPGHRACEIGYGIRSLILSCKVNLSNQSSEELTEQMQERFEDDIQHVDLITNSL